MRPARAMAVAAAVALFAGCTAADLRRLYEDDPPPVEVLAVAARFPTETSGAMELRLAIPNRGDEKLTAVSITWEVWLEDRLFSSGLQSLSFEVAPREERVLYLNAPLTFRRMQLRRGPIRLQIGLRGKMQAIYGELTEGKEPRGLPFSRRMEVLCENAPIFPLPGKLQE
jgi:hypothetical protein